MELEPSFFRLHARLLDTYTTALGPRGRRILEYTALFAFSLLTITLVHLHTTFVASDTCVGSFLIEEGFASANVIRLEVLSPLQVILQSCFPHQHYDKRDFIEERECPLSPYLPKHFNLPEALSETLRRFAWEFLPTTTYEYAKYRGYLLLSPELRKRHNVTVLDITLPYDHECLGGAFTQAILEEFVGYDAPVLTAFQSISRGKGFVVVEQHNHLYAMNIFSHATAYHISDYKVDVLLTSVFLFFSTTTIIGVVLRETHLRMLHFAIMLGQLEYAGSSVWRPIVANVSRVITYIIILSGVAYFIGDFLGDQGLCWILLVINWVAQLFTIISARSATTLVFWPKFYLLMQLSLYVYIVSFPYGFTYLATLAAGLCMCYSIIYFINRYELPALESGQISLHVQRMMPIVHVVHVIEQLVELIPGGSTNIYIQPTRHPHHFDVVANMRSEPANTNQQTAANTATIANAAIADTDNAVITTP